DGPNGRVEITARVGNAGSIRVAVRIQTQEQVGVRIGIGKIVALARLGSCPRASEGRTWLLDGSSVLGDEESQIVSLIGRRGISVGDSELYRVGQRITAVAVQDPDGLDARRDVACRARIQIGWASGIGKRYRVDARPRRLSTGKQGARRHQCNES